MRGKKQDDFVRTKTETANALKRGCDFSQPLKSLSAYRENYFAFGI